MIAATNRDLPQAVARGDFREDLYYRLNVFPLVIPPLRKRRVDIPLLVQHCVTKFRAKMNKPITHIPLHIMEALQAYDWPGNVRELENIIERAVILSQGPSLELGDWLPKLSRTPNGSQIPTLEELEQEYILKVLEYTGWRVSGQRGAAKILGMKRTTLESRMKKLGITRKG